MRAVDVTQVEGNGSCFSCLCSFKRADEPILEVQQVVDIKEKYKSVLRGARPEQLPRAERFDDPR